jgi:mono/diheme cytochrome c family protein
MSGTGRIFREGGVVMWTMTRISYAALAVGCLMSLVQCGAAGARNAAQRMESGARGYQEYCAMCHGNEGYGDGDVAGNLRKDASVSVARLNDAGRLSVLKRAGVRKVIVEGGAHTGRSNLMPAWGDKLSATLVEDITDYVMALPQQKPGIPASTIQKYLEAPEGSPAEGRALYVHSCAACHGPYGKGDGSFAQALRQKQKIRPRNLTDSTYMATRTDKDLYVTISLGGGHLGKSPYMPAWAVYLSPEQIQDLVSYIRTISRTVPRP